MKVKIRRIDKSLPLPQYHTKGAAAQDCSAREKVEIAGRGVGHIPLNICVKPPKNHFVILAARSSLHKRGLLTGNGIGIIDEDYAGNADEYRLVVYNYTDAPVVIEQGDRVGQIVFLPFDRVEWEEVENMEDNDRGGFGSTGSK